MLELRSVVLLVFLEQLALLLALAELSVVLLVDFQQPLLIILVTMGFTVFAVVTGALNLPPAATFANGRHGWLLRRFAFAAWLVAQVSSRLQLEAGFI